MKTVLLIGAHGFLATALKRELRQAGFSVKTVARGPSKADKTLPDFCFDIAKREAWTQLNVKVDAVIHAAAILPAENSFERSYFEKLIETQCYGTYNLCEWIKHQETVSYVLNISSLAVVGKPWPQPLTEETAVMPNGNHALYGLSKAAQEVLLSSFPFQRPVTIAHARLSSLFGEQMQWSGILCRLVDQVLDHKAIELMNGQTTFADFLYVRDAARALTELLKVEASGVVNVASGLEISLCRLAEHILNVMKVRNIQVFNREMGSPPQRAQIGLDKLKSLIPFVAPTDFEEALHAVVNWRLLTRETL